LTFTLKHYIIKRKETKPFLAFNFFRKKTKMKQIKFTPAMAYMVQIGSKTQTRRPVKRESSTGIQMLNQKYEYRDVVEVL